MVSCLECDNQLTITQPKVGQLVVCSNCAVELEIVSAYPLELDWADAVDDDDWDDDDDDDDDDDWDDDDS